MNTETKTATDLGPVNPENNGDQRLYQLDPPLPGFAWNDEDAPQYEYVVVSAADVSFSGPETYIFGSDKTGEIVSWSELDGSFKGDLDHGQALRNAGYVVKETS